MTKALLETGKHTVTAITRAESNSKFPEGVETKQVNYEDVSTIVDALRGQDALVITLSVFAHGQQEKLIQAAADANVPWVLPNEWSPDTDNAGLVKDIGAFQEKPKIREKIQQLGKSSYISVVTGSSSLNSGSVFEPALNVIRLLVRMVSLHPTGLRDRQPEA